MPSIEALTPALRGQGASTRGLLVAIGIERLWCKQNAGLSPQRPTDVLKVINPNDQAAFRPCPTKTANGSHGQFRTCALAALTLLRPQISGQRTVVGARAHGPCHRRRLH